LQHTKAGLKMLFTPLKIPGSYVIELDKREDDRGFFARLFCEKEFAEHGLETRFMQGNNSLSLSKGTLRGMHYQQSPAEEVKLVRCVRGAVFDVLLDLRPDSPTYKAHFGVELSSDNRKMLYIPRGCAHGFYTLVGDSELVYLVSAPYSPEFEKGVRFDDPAFNIVWPSQPLVVSDRDMRHPDYEYAK